MKSLLVVLFLFGASVAFAQTEIEVDVAEDVIVEEVVFEDPSMDVAPDDENIVFVVVEVMPEFPGGVEKRDEFLQKKLKTPKSAKPLENDGKVFVKFVIEKDGRITAIQTIKGLGAEYDAEAERVVGLFPKWVPGKQNGKPVRVAYVLPIPFKAGSHDRKK